MSDIPEAIRRDLAERMRNNDSVAIVDSTEPTRWACTMADYHADTTHIGHSMLDVFRRSRQEFYQRFILGYLPPTEPTDSMRLGTALHCALFEPELYEGLIAREPPLAPDGKKWLRRKGSDHERWWGEVVALNAGKLILTDEQESFVPLMSEAIRANPPAAKLLDASGEVETGIRWNCPDTSIPCKCRPDKLVDGLIVDIKTARDPSPRGFARACAALGYHRQAAHYIDGVLALTNTLPAFVFIVVGNQPPFDSAVYELDAQALELGRKENDLAMMALARCYESNEWREPTWGQITTLALPTWAAYQSTEWEYPE